MAWSNKKRRRSKHICIYIYISYLRFYCLGRKETGEPSKRVVLLLCNFRRIHRVTVKSNNLWKTLILNWDTIDWSCCIQFSEIAVFNIRRYLRVSSNCVLESYESNQQSLPYSKFVSKCKHDNRRSRPE